MNSGNYDLSYQGNNLTITKALLNVIADAKTKVYGDADPSLTYQVSGLKNGDTAGAVLNGGSLSRVAGENVGVYGINQGDLALNSGNYDLSYHCENHYIHSFELENGRIKRNREFMNPMQKLRALGIAVPQIKRDGIPT